MKPTDLRIGNIVKLKDSGSVIVVSAITKRKIGVHAPNERPNAQLRYRKLYEIEGVSIYDHWDKIHCCQLTWCGYEDGDEKYLYYWRSYPHKVIRYIHELQNLHYALKGEELNIEL